MLWYTSKQVQWLIRERPHLVSVLASSAVDRGFEPGFGSNQRLYSFVYTIGIGWVTAKHTECKNKDGLAQNQGNVSQ